MRTFTVYPHSLEEAEPAEKQHVAYGIRATYAEPALDRRYGALEVCRGLSRDQVLEQFRKVHRHDAAAVLGRDLSFDRSVQIEMGSDELRNWNN